MGEALQTWAVGAGGIALIVAALAVLGWLFGTDDGVKTLMLIFLLVAVIVVPAAAIAGLTVGIYRVGVWFQSAPPHPGAPHDPR